MLDFVGFTEMAISRDPTGLIAELNDVFTAFDRIVEGFGGERIKTLGDAYIAVCGIPDSGPDDGANIARIALRLVHYLERRNAQHAQAWRCRVGINIGPVIGSVIGVQVRLGHLRPRGEPRGPDGAPRRADVDPPVRRAPSAPPR
jgi:class 3 adenylate cyclase